ncbi:MAG: energy transducer TonB [Desulfovibrio sp.]|nr:energy transducer TonB [Desulfovibrio sp.]
MARGIFTLPSKENHGRALEVSSMISFLLHGLMLGALGFAFPAPAHKPAEEAISIDLALLAEEAPAPKVVQAAEAAPEPEKALAPPEPEEVAPVARKVTPPKPAPPKKAESRKADAPKKAVQAVASLKPAQGAEPVSRPAAKPAAASQPAPLGGASAPRPAYPELARKRGQEGTVNVRCQVDAAGLVTGVALAKSSGFKLLDEAALKAVSKWKFRPGQKDGASVAGTVVVPVQFKLQ